MKKINPIYLWYSIILMFLPIHELGHVIIAKLIGENITNMHWNHITVIINKYDFIQDWWEYSPLIFLFCFFLFCYYYNKQSDKKLIELKVIHEKI